MDLQLTGLAFSSPGQWCSLPTASLLHGTAQREDSVTSSGLWCTFPHFLHLSSHNQLPSFSSSLWFFSEAFMFYFPQGTLKWAQLSQKILWDSNPLLHLKFEDRSWKHSKASRHPLPYLGSLLQSVLRLLTSGSLTLVCIITTLGIC